MDDKIFSNDQDKLNWMYKTPGTSIDREEYLLGRPVDKSFELAIKEEQGLSATAATNQPKNYVDHECVPPSIRDLKNSKLPSVSQVDLASKLKDDPLTLIRKQQTELKRKLIENQLKLTKTDPARIKIERIERDDESIGRTRTLKKSKSSKSDALDDLLYEKFLLIRKFVSKRDLESPKKKSKKKSKKRKRTRSSSSSSSSSTSSSSSSSTVVKNSDDKKYSQKHQKKPHVDSRNGKKVVAIENAKKPKLTEEERQMKLQEMVSNADWRDQDIRKKVTEAHKKPKDDKNSKYNQEDYKNSFLSKTYMNVANSSTIENQIKSKIQFNQKSKSSMNSNFCRK